MKIIIIEDNDLLRKIIFDKLKHHFPGEKIGIFENGEDAVKEIRQTPIDIAVLDIHLPGMNGLQITHLLREEWPEVFIIIYTNYDIPEYREVSMESGANCFLSKEKNDPEDLVRLIKTANIKV